MELNIGDLKKLLEEAFDAGWYGSLSLKDETIAALLNKAQLKSGSVKIVLDKSGNVSFHNSSGYTYTSVV